MINLKLNKRLERIAFQVENNSKILDVGCDHALLDIYLTQDNRNITAVASDINAGPLEKAKENIRKYNLEDKIETRLGSGIEIIDESIDTIVISGMGGLTMIGILKYKKIFLKNVEKIILSPNNYAKEVRKEVIRLGYYLENEELVKENNHIYPILVFKKGKKRYNEVEYVYGPCLLKKKTKIFIEFLEEEKIKKEHLLKVLPKKYWQRRHILKSEIRRLNKILQKEKA